MSNNQVSNSDNAYLSACDDSDEDLEVLSSNTPNDPPPINATNASSSSQQQFFNVGEAKKQIVITNLREPFGDESNREKTDICTVEQILWAIDVGEFQNGIQKVSRIGVYNSMGKPRPIIVEFKSKAAVKAVIFNSAKLEKFLEWKNVSIKLCQPLNSQNLSQVYDQEKEDMKQQIGDLQKQLATIMQVIQQKSDQPNACLQSQMADHGNVSAHAMGQLPEIPNLNAQPQSANPINNILQNNQVQSQFDGIPPPMPSQLNIGIPNFKNLSPMEKAQLYQLLCKPNPTANEPSNLPNQNEAKILPQKEECNDDQAGAIESSSESEEDDHISAIVKTNNQLFTAQSEQNMGPKKILNILVLGETGVGKSTWINGIANYMSFNTLEDAITAGEPLCLIASQFAFYETKERKIEVKLEPTHGEKDENETFSDGGQSSTQEPKTYQFETAKYIINFIDTPGIGDTRGPQKDQENTRKILNAIGQYKDLHAICFLFKANEARMTLSFRYCIGELLLQLHKNAVDNIIFFFTNARGTFYQPGDTMTPLYSFLDELRENRGLHIQLNSEKTFCTDNEAFRLVCAHFNGALFTDEDFRNFAGSWKQSATETHRFLEFAARSKPHHIADTLSINKARTIILYLAKPLADVNELIESNIKAFNDRKKDLHNTANSVIELKKKTKMTQIGIIVKPLDYPKTVCAAAKCISTEKLPNTDQSQTIYKQICHGHCYLSGVEVEKVPEPHLESCAAMCGQNCRECHCHWSSHMHIRFDQIKTTSETEDKATATLIAKNENAAKIKEKMMKDCEEIIKEYKKEQQTIIEVSLRFGSFLQKNAILPYNDAFEKYVEQTICEEEKCAEVGGDRTKLENLKKLLKQYRQEKAMLEEAAKNPTFGGQNQVTTDEIDNMKLQLFGLKHSGKTLENLFKATGDGIALNNKFAVVRYNPAAPRSSQRKSYSRK